MGMTSGGKGLRADDFKVSDTDRPGWVRASTRTPEIGESVYCAAGVGTVLSVRGRTGDGSSLIQIRLEAVTAPYFAASSNVLVTPC